MHCVKFVYLLAHILEPCCMRRVRLCPPYGPSGEHRLHVLEAAAEQRRPRGSRPAAEGSSPSYPGKS